MHTISLQMELKIEHRLQYHMYRRANTVEFHLYEILRVVKFLVTENRIADVRC